MGKKEDSVFWVTCPECGSKIGIFLSAGIERVTVEEAPVKAGEVLSLEALRENLASEDVDFSLVTVEEGDDKFIVIPKGFIGDPWRPINDTIRSMGGEWISDGKRSRWEIKKTLEENQ